MPIRRFSYEELDPQLQQLLRPKVERLGYLGEFFAVGGHQPAATSAFQEFTEALKGSLPAELSEVIALTVASALGNDYERSQHEQLASVSGFSDEWIAAAEGKADVSSLGPLAALARSLAIAVLEEMGRGPVANAKLEELVAAAGEATAVGVLLTVGRYVAHALVANTLGLQPPVPFVISD